MAWNVRHYTILKLPQARSDILCHYCVHACVRLFVFVCLCVVCASTCSSLCLLFTKMIPKTSRTITVLVMYINLLCNYCYSNICLNSLQWIFTYLAFVMLLFLCTIFSKSHFCLCKNILQNRYIEREWERGREIILSVVLPYARGLGESSLAEIRRWRWSLGWTSL